MRILTIIAVMAVAVTSGAWAQGSDYHSKYEPGYSYSGNSYYRSSYEPGYSYSGSSYRSKYEPSWGSNNRWSPRSEYHSRYEPGYSYSGNSYYRSKYERRGRREDNNTGREVAALVIGGLLGYILADGHDEPAVTPQRPAGSAGGIGTFEGATEYIP